MKALTPLLAIALAAGSLASAQEPATPPKGQRVLGFFVGTLPCGDCSGIVTELTLFAPEGSGPASYWLRETYLGKPAKDATFESGGSWSTQAGAHDRKAIVYRLTEARSRESRYFLKVSDDELRMLDRSGRPIESKLDQTLKRQPASNEIRSQVAPPDQYLLGVYRGTLSVPGHDDALLELSLFARQAEGGLSSYWLKETRPGGSSTSGAMESHGDWTFGSTWWADDSATLERSPLDLRSADGRDRLLLAEQRPDTLKLIERRGVKMAAGGAILQRVSPAAGTWPESVGCERLRQGQGIDSSVGTIRCANTVVHYDIGGNAGDWCAGKVAMELHPVDGTSMKICALGPRSPERAASIAISLPEQIANVYVASPTPQDTMVLLSVARNMAIRGRARADRR
jgi:copper homeostasis protein (lipoprotein)